MVQRLGKKHLLATSQERPQVSGSSSVQAYQDRHKSQTLQAKNNQNCRRFELNPGSDAPLSAQRLLHFDAEIVFWLAPFERVVPQ